MLFCSNGSSFNNSSTNNIRLYPVEPTRPGAAKSRASATGPFHSNFSQEPIRTVAAAPATTYYAAAATAARAAAICKSETTTMRAQKYIAITSIAFITTTRVLKQAQPALAGRRRLGCPHQVELGRYRFADVLGPLELRVSCGAEMLTGVRASRKYCR